MFKKLLTVLFIALFTVIPVLGSTGIVKAEENSIKVDVKYITGKYADYRKEYQIPIGFPNIYVLADGERVGKVPLSLNWNTYTYQGEYKSIDDNKKYTVELGDADFSYYDKYRRFSKWYSCSYDTDIQGSAEEGFTVTNTLMTNIRGKVAFIDEKYPSEIKIKLLKNDKVIDTIVTNASKNWEYDFGKYCAIDDNGEEIVYNVTAEEIDGHYERLWGYDIEIIPCSTVTLTKELKGESKEKEFGVYILPNYKSHLSLWQDKLAARYPLSLATIGYNTAHELINRAKEWDKVSGSEPIYPVVSSLFNEKLVNDVMKKENLNDTIMTKEEFEWGYDLVRMLRDWLILEGEAKYDTTMSGTNVDPDNVSDKEMVNADLASYACWYMFKYAPDKVGDDWNSEYTKDDGSPDSELSEVLAGYPYENFQDYINKSVKNKLYFYTTIKPGETKTVEFPVENLYSLLIVESDYEDTKEPEAIKVIKLDRPVYRNEDYSDISFNHYEATLTNIGTPSPVDVTLTGKKTLTGRDIKDNEFSFEVKENNEIVCVATNKGEDITFPAINYTSKDIGTHTYTISEKKENLNGVEYDSHVETVIVNVSDNGDGSLKTEIYTDNDGILFTNKYSSMGSINLLGLKKYENHDMDTFKFELYKDNTLIQTVENDSEGEMKFDMLDYDLEDVGEHEYIIKEINDSKENVEYDTHEEKVKIIISDNGDGTLKVTPEYDEDGIVFTNKYNEPEAPTEEPTTETPKETTAFPKETTVQETIKQETVPEKQVEKTGDVKTGDTSISPMIIIGICAAAGIGITGLVIKKRKSE